MDVLQLMKDRLADAEADAERLRAAIAELEGDAPARAPRPRAKPARSGAAATTRATATTVVPLGTLLKAVAEHPGTTTTSLAKLTGGHQPAILQLLKEAESDGDVRREGERRATSWFLVTDEDRIAARAAELESRRRAPAAAGA